VYSAAAVQLLERPLAGGYRREQTEHYAARKKLAAPAKISVIIFRLGAEWYGLATKVFQEVTERRPMHTLPHRRHGIALGLVNVRGELLVCASLARLLGLEEPESRVPRSASRVEPGTANPKLGTRHVPLLLVAERHGERIAFPVDEVEQIQRFQEDELREAPTTVARSTLTYTRGVVNWRPPPRRSRLGAAAEADAHERVVGILNADLLFDAMSRSLT
jgi:chemotaxis-related protein WspD